MGRCRGPLPWALILAARAESQVTGPRKARRYLWDPGAPLHPIIHTLVRVRPSPDDTVILGLCFFMCKVSVFM